MADPLTLAQDQGFPNNLPHLLTGFIGREQELNTAHGLLNATRLLTLTGPGGVGKTRLAVQLASRALLSFQDGTWLVELAPLLLKESNLVAQTIAAALNLAETGDQSHLDRLQRFLASKTCLLVLDNCEHLIEECAQVVQSLLKTCPGLRVLATSRETLAVEGEVVFRVPSLQLPAENSSLVSTDELLKYESVQLLVERARLVQPNFKVTEQNKQALVELCRRLDGIPLALELAAARLSGLTIEQLTTRLDDRFRLLASGRRGALPRHQTLKALVDWSYELLSPAEQTLLRRLAVFAGGWSLEAAEAVAGFTPLQTGEVLELLLALINKSLVQMDPNAAQPRYSFLETIHHYSREKLGQARQEEASVRVRHSTFFLQLARQWVPEFEGPKVIEARAILNLEQNNFRAALGWSLEGYPLGNEAGKAATSIELKPAPSLAAPMVASIVKVKREQGLRLSGALWRFWQEQSLIQEGLHWLVRVLEAYDGLGLEESPGSELSSARLSVLHGVAVLFHLKGDFEQATKFHHQHIERRRDLEDFEGLAAALYDFGWCNFFNNKLEEALRLGEESLALALRLKNPQQSAAALYLIGILATVQNDFDRAIGLLEESLTIWQEIGHPGSIAAVFQILGQLYLSRHNYEQAEVFMLQALEIRWQEGNIIPLMAVFELFGYLAAKREKWYEAAFLEAAAERIRESLGIVNPPIFAVYTGAASEQSRVKLGQAAFDEAVMQGKKANLEQILEVANSIPGRVVAEIPTRIPVSGPGAQKRFSASYSLAGLSKREVEVLELVTEGLSNPQIAARLVLSPRTVDAHLRTIYSKLGVTSRTGAAHYAMAHHFFAR